MGPSNTHLVLLGLLIWIPDLLFKHLDAILEVYYVQGICLINQQAFDNLINIFHTHTSTLFFFLSNAENHKEIVVLLFFNMLLRI